MIFDLPKDSGTIIKVLGVGGGGSNAVNHMYRQGIVGVDFAICNTDSQALETSPVPTKIHLGPSLTEGRGAGSKPNVGALACEESIEDIKKYLSNNCKMLFITAGMGGGTGTGAAPIIAKAARDMGILTVGIITLPFTFEGRRRAQQGEDGLMELKNNVDTLIVISNDKLRQIFGNLSLSSAFSQADDVLTTAAKGIAEIITVAGYVNVDFEDVNTVMRDSGVAIMGTATSDGDDRARSAVDQALHSPLLEENDIRGAQHILLNITSGTKEVTMDEIFEITEFVQEEAGYGTDLIWGNCFDESLGEKISVTLIATGFERNGKLKEVSERDNKVVSLDADETASYIKPTEKSGLSDIGYEGIMNTNTVEFENVRETVHRYQKATSTSMDEGLTADEAAELRRLRQLEEKRRREILRTRAHSMKLNNPKVVNELENEPAYLRRGVRPDKAAPSDQEMYSSWTVSDNGDQVEIQEGGNSFLHDNVD